MFWDGRVPICCLDYNGEEIMGDLKTHSILEIINSTKYNNYRAYQLTKNPPKICRCCNNPKHRELVS